MKDFIENDWPLLVLVLIAITWGVLMVWILTKIGQEGIGITLCKDEVCTEYKLK